mgnify:CR=1 FL=1
MTLFQPSGEKMFIYDAAMKYMAEGTPTVIFGAEPGTALGSVTRPCTLTRGAEPGT